MARILVVDDYPPLAKVIAIGLRRNGHEVERAGSQRRALEVEGLLDAAVIDVDLPDGNGIDVAATLLAEQRVGLVIFFSATRDTEARQRALALGPFVDKSTGVDPLLELVEDELAARASVAKAVGAPDQVVSPTARSGTRRRVSR